MRFLPALIALTWALLAGSMPLSAKTLTVGKQQDFPSINQAISAAAPGDTVLIKAGLYREPLLVIAKPLTVLGEAGATVDGQGQHTLIAVKCDRVTISGLCLENTGTSYVEERSAIYLSNCTQARISGNRLLNCLFGIFLSGCSDCCVTDNIIIGPHQGETASGNGVHMWHGQRMQIRHNDVCGQRDGIYLEFADNSTIADNISHENARYGMHFMFSNGDKYFNNTFQDNGAGVAVMYSRKVDMENNRFQHNWGAASYGLLIKELSDGSIRHCLFERNTTGLQCDGANRMEIAGNEFKENGRAIRIVSYSANNGFTQNNFLANTFDLVTTTASDSNRFHKNYWDRNDGYDLNHDGIADVAYSPVRASSAIVENYPAAALLVRSPLFEILDLAEQAFPTLAPPSLLDAQPLMRKIRWTNI